MAQQNAQTAPPRAVVDVFLAALRLGLTSFGGPVAHLGYFRAEYVERRHWLDEAHYADLVGLCQFLPGPASSELGIAIGITRAGLPGGLAAWLGFTLPSAVALTIFAAVVRRGGLLNAGWLHGLQIVAVAVVAQAVWNMARTLAPDRARATIAISAAIVALVWTTPASQVLIITAAAMLGWRLLAVPVSGTPADVVTPPVTYQRTSGQLRLGALLRLAAGTTPAAPGCSGPHARPDR